MPKLTGWKPPGEHRRAALVRRAIVIIAFHSIAGAALADEPGLLERRALGASLLDQKSALDRRRLGAAFVPSLKLTAALARMDGKGGPWSVTAWATLSWPLEPVPNDPVARIRARRREDVAAEVAEIWRRREALRRKYETDPTVSGELDVEEAQAELDALTDGATP